MEKMSLKELSIPIIKAIDSFNYLLKSHHRRTSVISYAIGSAMKLPMKRMTNLILAAAMHDIGALSIQERNTLIQEDVVNPHPHCLMGYKMLSSFEIFNDISRIIKHHHIKYQEVEKYKEEIPIESHIVHLADRVDIYISSDEFILNQKSTVTKKIEERVGTVFHPEIFDAFLTASKSDIFWININNMTMEEVLGKIDYSLNIELPIEKVVEFSQVLSRIVDFRSRYTATHSFTVGHLAYHIGGFLGFERDYCIKLLVAGYLHDIGKIAIDPSLIEKKGKLTETEYNMVKLHSYYSGKILQELSHSDWFKEIIVWSSHHHEKIDNSGYPYGVGDKELSDGVRIIAFADVIAALRENRPYRSSLGIEKTFEIIDKDVADKISRDIYEKISQNITKINEVVLYCQKEGQKVYPDDYSV